MRIVDAIHNRRTVPGFLVNSMPKAGTHLLMKAVGLFPGIRRSRVNLTNRLGGRFDGELPQDVITIGVDWPKPVPRSFLRRHLKRINRGHYAQAHTLFSEELATELSALGLRTLLILRDPRDVVVSHAKFVASRPQHFLHDHYTALSEDEQVMTSIVGLARPSSSGPGLHDVAARYRLVMPWLDHPLNHTTTFESLVGPRGGGSRDSQIGELQSIARHLGIRCSESRIERIAEQIFGGTTTFRKGTIGSWRENLNDEQQRVVKQIAGQTLIDLGYEKDLCW